MIDFSKPLQGMHNAEATMNTAARQIARGPFSMGREGEDTVDLSSEMVSLMQSRSDFETNVKVARTQDEMVKSTLSLIG